MSRQRQWDPWFCYQACCCTNYCATPTTNTAIGTTTAMSDYTTRTASYTCSCTPSLLPIDMHVCMSVFERQTLSGVGVWCVTELSCSGAAAAAAVALVEDVDEKSFVCLSTVECLNKWDESRKKREKLWKKISTDRNKKSTPEPACLLLRRQFFFLSSALARSYSYTLAGLNYQHYGKRGELTPHCALAFLPIFFQIPIAFVVGRNENKTEYKKKRKNEAENIAVLLVEKGKQNSAAAV